MEQKYCEDKKSEWNWEMKERKITMKEGARITLSKIFESMSDWSHLSPYDLQWVQIHGKTFLVL